MLKTGHWRDGLRGGNRMQATISHTHEKLHDSFLLPDNIEVTKSGRIRIGACTILVGKT
jgi:hypothetical protein